MPPSNTLERLHRLLQWPRIARIVAQAAKEALGPHAETYIIGGAAENRLTALSDIDILITLPHDPAPEEIPHLARRVYEKAVELGMPWDYPIDIHIAGPRLLTLYRRHAKKMLKITPTQPPQHPNQPQPTKHPRTTRQSHPTRAD